MTHSDKSMFGKICIVTGATSGIGKATARVLAQLGATVIVVGRSPKKSKATVSYIQKQTGNPRVEFMLADLSSQKDIYKLAQQFNSQYQDLHVLINNAGALFTTRQQSVDGIEMTFSLNYLNYFLLTNLLLDKLKASAPARIVNMAASAHKFVREVNFNNLESQEKYSGWQAYAQSKLCTLLFTYELARRLEGTRITVNTLHPGVIATHFGHNAKGLIGWMIHLTNLFAHGPERGAQTSIYLATSPSVEGVTGKYFVKKKEVTSSAASYNPATAKRLWQVSKTMVGLSD